MYPTQLPRKKPAKRAFTGLAGSPLSHVEGEQQKTSRKKRSATVTKLIAKQNRKEELRRQKEYFYEILKREGFEVGDDQPLLTSTRARHRNTHGPKFQRYQFRLRATGDRNNRLDRGMSPAIYDSMSANKEVRKSELDPEGADTADLHEAARRAESEFNPDVRVTVPRGPVTIANVAQSMPRGFSVGVLNPKFDFTDTPREPQPETAWAFDDTRLWIFISSLVADDALDRFELNPRDWVARELLIPALKAFTALYCYFRVGKTDKNFLSDGDLRKLQFWSSGNALRRYRSRLLKKGLETFGIPDLPKDLDNPDPERIGRVRKAVARLYTSLTARSVESAA